MNEHDRARFDRLVRDAVDSLPVMAQRALDEISIVIEDRPDDTLKRELARDGTIEHDEDDPLGLHTGTPLTERGADNSGHLPPIIHLFREPIVEHAGGWGPDADGDEDVYEEIRVTLLHEIGHHFGLDEDDLDSLGYA